MSAKIISVRKLEGVLAPFWEFEYAVSDHDETLVIGTLSVDQARVLADRPDIGAIFDMCRAIKGTVTSDFSWLVGRVFPGGTVAGYTAELPGQ